MVKEWLLWCLQSKASCWFPNRNQLQLTVFRLWESSWPSPSLHQYAVSRHWETAFILMLRMRYGIGEREYTSVFQNCSNCDLSKEKTEHLRNNNICYTIDVFYGLHRLKSNKTHILYTILDTVYTHIHQTLSWEDIKCGPVYELHNSVLHCFLKGISPPIWAQIVKQIP